MRHPACFSSLFSFIKLLQMSEEVIHFITELPHAYKDSDHPHTLLTVHFPLSCMQESYLFSIFCDCKGKL